MLDIIILAAGMGTRMKSQLPKVLHPIAGRPMILEVLATARALEPLHTVLVVGHGAEQVRAVVGEEATFALQAQQLGTGHAVMQAREMLTGSDADTALILYGDTPLTHDETLRDALTFHRNRRAAVTLLSFLPTDPTGYGRIVRNEAGRVEGIVEHRDATESQRAIQESNSGLMFFEATWLWANLERLTLSPKGEYYLTDMAGLAVAQGRRVEALVLEREYEAMGINDRVQLAEASQHLWDRRRRHWMLAGVTMSDPATVWIEADVTLGPDTTLHPNVMLRGKTTIGANCELGPHLVLTDATLPDGTRLAGTTDDVMR